MLDELYDLSADPGEKHNLIQWNIPDKLTPEQKIARAELDGKLHAWMESISDPLLKQP